MPHFKVDDAIHCHPKAVMAGDAAMGLWLRAGGFCTGYGTDGFVPDWWVKQQPQGKAKANRLVAVELWHPGTYQGNRPEYQGQTGYNFHEWRQDSYDKVESDREKWRKKKAAQRSSSHTMSPGDNTGDSPGDSPARRDSVKTLKPEEKSAEFARNARRSNAQNPKPDNASSSVNTRMSPGDSRESPGYIPNTQYPKNSGYVPESATESTARDSIAATPAADLVRKTIPPEINSAIQTQLRLNAGVLLKAGESPDVVKEALRDWAAKTGVGPNILASLAADVVKRRNGHARLATVNGMTPGEAKVAGWAELGNTSTQKAIEQ